MVSALISHPSVLLKDNRTPSSVVSVTSKFSVGIIVVVPSTSTPVLRGRPKSARSSVAFTMVENSSSFLLDSYFLDLDLDLYVDLDFNQSACESACLVKVFLAACLLFTMNLFTVLTGFDLLAVCVRQTSPKRRFSAEDSLGFKASHLK